MLKKIQSRITRFLRDGKIENQILKNRMLSAKILARQNKILPPKTDLHDSEFKVFSQWGDDGIIQYLIHKVNISNKIFIEFGVENYLEANTRFLLENDNWTGLIIDGSQSHIDYIKSDPIFWKHELSAVCSFITKENINSIIEKAGFKDNIGLLHIDIDGNDYWVWDAINIVKADIVIMEYNSVFGNEKKITIPYDPAFIRKKAHHSHLYCGASLAALCYLAEQKGYVFVGSNSNGNNAYFVLKEKAQNLTALSVKEGYVESKFREARNKENQLMFIDKGMRTSILKDLPFVNVETLETEFI